MFIYDTLIENAMIIVVDLSEIPEAYVGTAVTLLGEDGDEWISAQEISDWGDSVSGEVTAAISPRVPRVYISKGEQVNDTEKYVK